tara:strand:- start:462 stop:602 length:141 start_codon:yes stop_codon:yes gene_type:complete
MFSCVSSQKNQEMGHHEEPQENEIAGPVVFALFLFGIVIIAISFMA